MKAVADLSRFVEFHHSRTKHIDVRFHFLWKIIDEGDILLQKIVTAYISPDMMRKVISGIKFQHCLDLVNISQCSLFSTIMVHGVMWRNEGNVDGKISPR
jgi:hypothetical protein